MNEKVERIVKLAKEKTENTKQKVIVTINQLVSNGQEVNFYQVQKATGVSRAFLYNNAEVKQLIEQYRGKPIKKEQSSEMKDVIIETLKKEFAQKDEELKATKKIAEKAVFWENKCNELQEKNKELEKQLQNAYV